MKSNTVRINVLSLASATLLVVMAGCDGDAGADAGAARPGAGAAQTSRGDSGNSQPASDSPLAEFQTELLNLAFQAATAIPADPHIKDRSRAQEAVVTACLELDQPRTALKYLTRIDDWRRGVCYADLAFYLADHGDTANVQGYLNLAGQVAETATDWRRDRIRVKIARTHALLGQADQAAHFEADVVDSESGKVHSIRAQILDSEDFDLHMQAINDLAATGNFDLMRNALDAYAALFHRGYASAEQRSQAKARIDAASATLPAMIRADNLFALADFAIDHGDQATALVLVNEAQRLLDATSWSAEDAIPYRARLAKHRFLAGDAARARTDADALRTQFDAERESIVNIYRTETLCPLAEAYQTMKAGAAAMAVYKKAVEEGVVNPNSRPRAEDLSAVCCSMAVKGVEPDADLWFHMRQIYEGLGHPW